MRVCGYFSPFEKVARTKNRPQADGLARERVGASFLAVDHADCRAHDETGVSEGLDRLQQRAPGGDDVLDQAHGFALLVDALHPVRRSVCLRRLANDQERPARGQGAGRRERDRAELGTSEPRGVWSVLGDLLRDSLTERGEDLGAGLEAVLVEVVARALA